MDEGHHGANFPSDLRCRRAEETCAIREVHNLSELQNIDEAGKGRAEAEEGNG